MTLSVSIYDSITITTYDLEYHMLFQYEFENITSELDFIYESDLLEFSNMT